MLNNIIGYGTTDTQCDIPEVTFVDSSQKARYNNIALIIVFYTIKIPSNIKLTQYVNNTN